MVRTNRPVDAGDGTPAATEVPATVVEAPDGVMAVPCLVRGREVAVPLLASLHLVAAVAAAGHQMGLAVEGRREDPFTLAEDSLHPEGAMEDPQEVEEEVRRESRKTAVAGGPEVGPRIIRRRAQEVVVEVHPEAHQEVRPEVLLDHGVSMAAARRGRTPTYVHSCGTWLTCNGCLRSRSRSEWIGI
ncbi:MAG: hypothetical protein GY772_32100 [bacterium]|nr:hypothetical protein [bacterium]